MGKSKRKKQQDFQKVKLKVGKKLKKGDNVTNASFKSRGIQVSQQLKGGESSQPVTKKKQNITELFSHCRHYSPSFRHDAINGLKEILTENPHLIDVHLANIIEKSSELFTDKDSTVRQGVVKNLLKNVFSVVPENQIAPFFPLMCAHLCSAMTHIDDNIKVDSLTVLDLLLDHYPTLLVSKSNQVLPNFIEQISRQQGAGKSRSLSSNPNSATSTLKWRVSVLKRLQKFISALMKFDAEKVNQDTLTGTNKEDDGVFLYNEGVGNNMQPFATSARCLWNTPGYTLSSAKDPNKECVMVMNVTHLAGALVPLMLESWVEAVPSEGGIGRGKALDSMAAGVMYQILSVTQLLMKCVTSNQQTENMGEILKYQRDFETHFMNSFPYIVNNMASTGGKKDKKNKLVLDQVSAETLNLTVCDIMMSFLSDDLRNVPHWLPVITRYLSRALSSDRGERGGQNAALVISIVRRLCKCDCLQGQVDGLMDGLYSRYRDAGPLSKEKKTYLSFFAESILQHSQVYLREELVSSFLKDLPELMPLVTQENPRTTTLILQTLRVACCHGNAQFICDADFMELFTTFFDPLDGLVLKLESHDRQQLTGLLFYLPSLSLELVKMLTSLCRHDNIDKQNVAFLIQVLQNRYLRQWKLQKKDQREAEKEAVLYLGFLGNLLLGIPKVDFDSLAKSSDVSCAPYQPMKILDTLEPQGHTVTWENHIFLVEAVTRAVEQCPNTEQVVEIIFSAIENMLNTYKVLPLHTVYSVCKLAESLMIPEKFASFVKNSAISLVAFMVSSDQSEDQMAQHLIDTGLRVVSRVHSGTSSMIGHLKASLSTELDEKHTQGVLKIMLLVVKGDNQQKLAPDCSCCKQLHECFDNMEKLGLPLKVGTSHETETLFARVKYLLSLLK
ncbi:testis-expressed protein 10 homolog [Mya arenaria]|uniref:testis-expressed protein 10 homolog n=1 Tax=Mya arenaria TaxID=6604 RepID=UPI0022E1002F|nr:testis-expressed protein 10 homolog [Mya arenaria]